MTANFPGHTSLEVPKVAPGQPQGQAAAQQAALQAVPMGAPTQNPNEPVTAGAPIGPGAGIQALGPAGAAQMGGPNPDVEQLKQYLPTLEYLADQPDASTSTRNYVRWVRSQIVPGT